MVLDNGDHWFTEQSPQLSLYFRSIISISSAPSSSSKKVSDRIVKLFAIDLYSKKREVIRLSGQSRLKALANSDLIDPASHRLEEKWLERLPLSSYDEQYVLKRNSRAKVLKNKHSRLGCQVVLSPDLQY